MKFAGLPPASYRAALRGKLHFHYNKKYQQWIGRAWPRGHRNPSSAELASRAAFTDAMKAQKRITPLEYAAAKKLTTDTPFTPRDALTMAAYGRLIIAYALDGRIWRSAVEYAYEIQTLLNMLSEQPGSMVVRTANGWYALLPNDPGDVLTLDPVTGIPAWASGTPPPPDIQELLDGISDDVGALLLRTVSGWVAVAPGTDDQLLTVDDTSHLPEWKDPAPPAPDIQALLNGISATQGTILYRNATDWVALAPGTLGYVLSTQGASADIQWIPVSLSSLTTSDLAEGGNLYFTYERVDDEAAALIQNATGITWTYNDGVGTLTPALDVLALLDTISTTQGTTLYRGASAWSALAPGTVGQFLESLGASADPAWADLAGGGGTRGPSFHPGYVSGRYYETFNVGLPSTNLPSANTLYAVPFYCREATTFTKLAFRTTGTIAGNYEMGVYNNANGQPTTKLVDAGSTAVLSNQINARTGLTINLNVGWYWLVIAFSSASNIFYTTSTTELSWLLGLTDPTVGALCVNGPWTYSAGNLPANFPAISYTGNQAPRLLIGN